jgi:hypothetical protein
VRLSHLFLFFIYLYKNIIMKKEFINEINHYRNLMGLEPLNETYVFIDGAVKGGSSPSDDKIDSALLQDIETASNNSGVKVAITTAVDGHSGGGRHAQGYAVDIAMFYDDNGVAQGYSGGKEEAKKKGIYDKIMAFVSALESLGYKKNVGEEGNKKVVLTFGYPNHHHHVHVSNVTNRKKSSGETKKTETPKNLESEVAKNARLCGWGDDVDGYKNSGWKCPKPGTQKTEPQKSTGEILKQPAGDPYEYKKTPDGKYYTKKRTSSSWIDITGTKFETPIRQRVFKDL